MKRLFPVICLFSCLIAAHSFAGSATWNLNPISGWWNKPANWTPNTVPNGFFDTATFNTSSITAISGGFIFVEDIVFNVGASPFTITCPEGMTLSGTGITNNSGVTQSFVLTGSLVPIYITLENGASAGDMTAFTVTSGPYGNYMRFTGDTSAATGAFVIEGSQDSAFEAGGWLSFSGISTAANGTFTVNGGSVAGALGGTIAFGGPAATAANGVFIINGGTVAGALGGRVVFEGGTAGNATLIANPGTGGGHFNGGLIKYGDFRFPEEDEARIELFGNGTLQMVYFGGTVGSIEGDGIVLLGGNLLTTGTNNLSTTFSGTIDSGSLQKVGTGRFTLDGASPYTGGTTIEGGKLVVNNRVGSATGPSPVQVNAGALGGRGIIAGAVVIGTGSGSGAILAPGQRNGSPNTLTIQSTLNFNADGTYACGLDTKHAVADKVAANGVTINGARCALRDQQGFMLPPGTVLTVIDNTSANSTSGIFANLADGSTVTLGVNKLQVSYSGGDGNDLTLTVVP